MKNAQWASFPITDENRRNLKAGVAQTLFLLPGVDARLAQAYVGPYR